MSMLEFPTFEEMVAVMNGPTAPASPIDHATEISDPSTELQMEMSTDDMIREMFSMMRKMHGADSSKGVQIGNGGKANAANLSTAYDSNTSTYDGGVATMLYNGEM